MTTEDGEKPSNGTSSEKPATAETVANPTELEQKIVTQIDFYFGDSNLPRDKFMLEQVKIDNGWIPMSTMLKFQRLARLSDDANVIAEAVKHSQLVEVDTSSSEPKIRRSPEFPLPELNAERQKQLRERTVYCKGFALDSDLDKVMSIVNEHDKPENIYMRKYKDKITQTYHFKGSIFATFKTVDEAKTYLERETKLDDKILTKMWQNDYSEKKKKESEEKKNKGKSQPKKEQTIDSKFKKGSSFHLTGEFEGITRENIKEALEKLEVETAFISFSKGDKEAFVRLADENTAKPAVEKIGDGLAVNEVKLAARVLEGEEEEAYLKKSNEEKEMVMNRKKNRKGGGGKGKFLGKRKGGWGKRNDEPPKKKTAD